MIKVEQELGANTAQFSLKKSTKDLKDVDLKLRCMVD